MIGFLLSKALDVFANIDIVAAFIERKESFIRVQGCGVAL